MSIAIDKTNEIVGNVCKLGEERILAALNGGKSIGVTQLAAHIADDMKLKAPMCYHILSLYISQSDNLTIAMGKGGGIRFKPVLTPEVKLQIEADVKAALAKPLTLEEAIGDM